MAALYNEIEPFAAAWLTNLIAAGHIAKGDVDARSIADLRAVDVVGRTQCHFFAGIGVWSYALRLAGWPDDREVWTGSCPCQPFSAAGKGGGFDDDRHLWPTWFALIRECRPSVVFGEQVASPDGLKWFDLVHADLEGAGYAVGAADLCAAGVGAPHIRQRLFFVAYAEEERRGSRRAGEEGYGGRAIESCGLVSARELADTDGERFKGERVQLRERQPRSSMPEAGRCEIGELADASGARRREGDALGPRSRGGAPTNERRIGSANDNQADIWLRPDWLACTDGVSRPVEPGTFPLAHGAPSRVGRLRAYGNAIISQAAVTFIRAAMHGRYDAVIS
jgi:DNA (cytosine-5)-methyltransferase 1